MSGITVSMVNARQVLIGFPASSTTTYRDVSNKLQTVRYYAETTGRLYDSSFEATHSVRESYLAGASVYTGAADVTLDGLSVDTARVGWTPGATTYLTIDVAPGTRIPAARLETLGQRLDSADNILSASTDNLFSLALPGVFATPPSAPASVVLTPLPGRLMQIRWTSPAAEYITSHSLRVGYFTTVGLSNVARSGDVFTATFNPVGLLAADTTLTLTLGNGGLALNGASSTDVTMYAEKVSLALGTFSPYICGTQSAVATRLVAGGGSLTVTATGGGGGTSATLDTSGQAATLELHWLALGTVRFAAVTSPPSTVFPVEFPNGVGYLPYTITTYPDAGLVGEPIAVVVRFSDIGPSTYSSTALVRDYGSPGVWLNGANIVPLIPGTQHTITWLPSAPTIPGSFFWLADTRPVASGGTEIMDVTASFNVYAPDLRMWVTERVVKPGESITVSAGYGANVAVGGRVTMTADVSGTFSEVAGSMDTARGVVSRQFTTDYRGVVTFSGVGTTRSGKTVAAASSGPNWSSKCLVAGTSDGFLASPFA